MSYKKLISSWYFIHAKLKLSTKNLTTAQMTPEGKSGEKSSHIFILAANIPMFLCLLEHEKAIKVKENFNRSILWVPF